MTIEEKDILQLDAAVTTGLFIFMTLSLTQIPDLEGPRVITFGDIANRLLLSIMVLIPFVSSAVIVLISELLAEHFRGQNKVRNTLRKIAIILTLGGFAGIPFFLIGLLYFLPTFVG